VATDTMENLSSRLHGAETVAVEVLSRDGTSSPEWVRSVHEKLEKVAGVSRVIAKDSRDSRARFTVESLKDSHVRPELARAVIESGWQLNELHGMGLSLEEIFLELTASKADVSEPAPQATAEEA
jgi:ABC-2 type transport system ATP-binding protein